MNTKRNTHLQYHRLQCVTTMMLCTVLGGSGLLGATSALAAEASLVATAQSTLVVNTTGTSTLSVTPSESILAGTYSSAILVGTWEASTTVGSLAFRFNPTIMGSDALYPLFGTAKNKEDISKLLPIQIAMDSGYPCATNGGWRVCNQGVTYAKGYFLLRNTPVTITPGVYPISMDAAIWAY